MSVRLTVRIPFGPFAANDVISDPVQVASILAGPYAADVDQLADGVPVGTGSGSTNPGTGSTGATTPGLTLAQVDAEVDPRIAAAFVARGVPAGATVPGLIAAAVAAQAPGSGALAPVSFALSAVTSYAATHSFPYQPRAWLIDASGTEVETDVAYAASQVLLTFPTPFTGTLWLG